LPNYVRIHLSLWDDFFERTYSFETEVPILTYVTPPPKKQMKKSMKFIYQKGLLVSVILHMNYIM